MTKPHKHRPDTEDIDVATLGRALWRAKGWILGLAILAGIITFIGLSMVRPLFTSEARILIQNDESSFTRPTAEQGREQQVAALDEQAVQSQVQVLTSRDLAVEVIKALDLTNSPEFAKDAGVGPIKRFLNRIGLGRGSPKSEEEKAANAFAEHLSVFPLAKSSVIAIEYTSGDSPLAAKAANKLADVYIVWQREAKLEQTKDATAWLSAQIEVLRKKVAESEAAAEQFRASQGLFAGTNNVTLNAQQLSELNSQVILAKAQNSEAEARARLIKKMLADKGDIDATPEVLKSELIGRLIDQRVQVQRQLAELSATLMPSHPRIKQLTSELADVRTQILDEATKIVKGLENESEVASARESSLRTSLNDVKTQASGMSEAEINLRALEREAKANRDLLESYLARYRDASARHDMGAVPAQAAIVSRAHASVLPSFPKRGPITLLVAAATALLALAYVLARELIGAPAERREPLRADEPRVRERRIAPAQPAVASAKPFTPAEQVRPAAAVPPKAPPAVASTPKVEPAMVAITKAVPAAFFTPRAEPVSPPKAETVSPPIVQPTVASAPKTEPVSTPRAEPAVASPSKAQPAAASVAKVEPVVASAPKFEPAAASVAKVEPAVASASKA
ncbi:MAG: Wzz/FepE/Etk N-terminal domain-containing protein, partial [Methyloceanibacter sp.]